MDKHKWDKPFIYPVGSTYYANASLRERKDGPYYSGKMYLSRGGRRGVYGLWNMRRHNPDAYYPCKHWCVPITFKITVGG